MATTKKERKCRYCGKDLRLAQIKAGKCDIHKEPYYQCSCGAFGCLTFLEKDEG